MDKLYNFRRLVDKYSTNIIVKTSGAGHYEAGHYVPGEVGEKSVRGTIMPYSTIKVYQSGGNIKTADRQLYLLEPFDLKLDDVKVEYKGKSYKVEEESDYTNYSDVYVYKLVYVEGLTNDRV